MRLKCVAHSGVALPESYLDDAGGYSKQTIFPLRVGEAYLVYAVTLRRGGVWFYLQDDRAIDYPVWYPGPLFDVVDGRLSRFWVFGLHQKGVRDGDSVFAFPEWAQDPHSFYDSLSSGESAAKLVYRNYRELMELEFAEIVENSVAIVVGDGWLQCAQCSDAWQTTAVGERVRCPKCGFVQGNPRLKDR